MGRLIRIRTDIRLRAEQFLVCPDIPTGTNVRDEGLLVSMQKLRRADQTEYTYEQQPPKTRNSIKE